MAADDARADAGLHARTRRPLAAVTAHAQRGRWFDPAGFDVPIDKAPAYDGRFTFARLKFATAPGGYYFGGLPAWAHGVSEYWEYSASGFAPIDLSNEAYKLGVNYVIYGMTH